MLKGLNSPDGRIMPHFAALYFCIGGKHEWCHSLLIVEFSSNLLIIQHRVEGWEFREDMSYATCKITLEPQNNVKKPSPGQCQHQTSIGPILYVHKDWKKIPFSMTRRAKLNSGNSTSY